MPGSERQFMLFHPIDAVNQGSILQEWPMHMTLTPFYSLDEERMADAEAFIRETAESTESITISEGRHALYGPASDIPVVEVREPTGRLRELHHDLVKGLGAIGARFSDLTYALDAYSPHISVRSGRSYPSFPRDVDSLVVATKLPKGYDANKIIYRKIELG